MYLIVSIHAPARGATQVGGDGHDGPAVSIHAPARGATDDDGVDGLHYAFQSTPPRGERPGSMPTIILLIGFNPRPRAGSDHLGS